MGKKPFKYEVTKLSDDTYLINETYSTMFILCGTQRALVIDCGTGVSDFKSLIESITPLPYTVAATHAHVDHIGGRGQFDKIYVSEPDCGFVRSNKRLMRGGFAFSCKFSMGANFSGIKIRNEPEPDIITFINGEEFDLGGRTVRAIYTPGHTVGSTSFLDVERRTIFIGDVSNENLLMFLPHSTTIDEMVETISAIINMDCYDTIWSSHHTQPQSREDMKKFLAGAKQVANRKNSVLPLIKTNNYQGAILVYRANRVHKN